MCCVVCWKISDHFYALVVFKKQKEESCFNGQSQTLRLSYFRFTVSNGGAVPISREFGVGSFPLVQLHGHHKLVLEHYPSRISASGRYEVRLHESQWVIKSDGYQSFQVTFQVKINFSSLKVSAKEINLRSISTLMLSFNLSSSQLQLI